MQCWSPEVSWSDDRVRHTYPGHQEELVDEIWAWVEGIVVHVTHQVTVCECHAVWERAPCEQQA